MLTGRQLLEAGDVSEILASVLVKDPNISGISGDVPTHIRSVVRRCLVKDPKERLRDIGDVRLAMSGVFETTVSVQANVPASWKSADGTGDVEPLGEASGQYPQALSPDAATLVFEQRADGSDLGMLSLEGDRSSRLPLRSEFSERNAALLPDGRWLACNSDESGQREVYVRPFPDIDAGRW